jgi:hypothetical protein
LLLPSLYALACRFLELVLLPARGRDGQPPLRGRGDGLGWGAVKYSQGRYEEAERLGLKAREWLERTSDTNFQVQSLVRPWLSSPLPKMIRGSRSTGCWRRPRARECLADGDPDSLLAGK